MEALIAISLFLSPTLDEWPDRAEPYREIWEREFPRSGLHPDYEAWLLGQITTESDWNPDAVSSTGALGLTQVEPYTANALHRKYPQLQGCSPKYPECSIKMFLLLMKENILAFADAPDRETRYKFAAAAYNGGPSFLHRERHAAGGSWDWNEVRSHCRDFRSEASCKQNIAYPHLAMRRSALFRSTSSSFASSRGVS